MKNKLQLLTLILGLVVNTSIFAQNNGLQKVKNYLNSEITKGKISNSHDVVSLLKPDEITATGDITYGTESALSKTSYYVSVAALDATHFVYVYKTTTYYAVIGTISGTGISFGTAKSFSGGESIVATALDATHFAVAFNASDNGKAIVGEVSGTDITFGSVVAFDTDMALSISISTLDATHFVVAYTDQGNSSSYSRAVVGNVSGTSITSFGSYVDFYSGSSDYFSVSSLDATHFVVAYKGASSGYARIGVVSETEITYGTESEYSSATFDIAVAGLDATHFVVAFLNTGLRVIAGEVSGNTISSYGTEISNSATSTPIAISAVSSSDFVVSFCDAGDSDKGKAISGSVSGTTVSLASTSIYYSSGLDYNYTPFVTTMPNTSGDAQIVVTYIDGTSYYGRTRVGTIEGVTATPVELVSFTAEFTSSGTVQLNWETATEINNYGFEVQRTDISSQISEREWETLGFVEGHGNSVSPKYYEFVDENPLADSAEYRLKQIDTDGGFEYYAERVQVAGYSTTDIDDETMKLDYKLAQNYPNPFNPTTQIAFTIPSAGIVKLNVYNVLGEVVSELVNQNLEAGLHEYEFNASNLTSGIYFYSISVNGFREVRKMNLVK